MSTTGKTAFVASARAINVWGSPDLFYVGIELRGVGGGLIYSHSTGWVNLTNSYQDITLTVTSTGVGASSWALVDSVTLVLGGDDHEYWAGNYGPKVDSASLKLDGTELMTNTEFVDGDRNWTSSVGWQACSGGAGNKPCPSTGLHGATTASAPTSVSGTSGDGQVSVSWTAPASNGGAAVTDYIVQYSTSSDRAYTTFSDGTSTSTSATVTGLTNNTPYYFKVAAVNSVGTSTYSAVSASVTPKSVPPVVSSVTAGDGSLTFTWNAISHGGDVYRVNWDNASNFATGSINSTGGTSYTVTGLTNGTTYYFRVAGWNNSATPQIATTDWSATASGVPGKPSAPLSLSVSSGRNGMSVSWSAPSSNGGSALTDYVVQYTTTSGGSYSTFDDGTSTATSATITGLTAGSTYYVRVAAVNAITTGTYTAESSGVLSKTCANGGVCAVGDTGPGGGKVFYDAGSLQSWGRYLEAAPASATSTTWCNNTSTALTGTFGRAVGSGAINTYLMLDGCTSGAAYNATGYSNNGYSDWFLPSILDLGQMCANRATLGMTSAGTFKSSTQDTLDANNHAETWNFPSALGTCGNDNWSKSLTQGVRPIRAIGDATAPTASVTSASISASGSATIRSSEIGRGFLVNTSVTVTNLASITGASGSLWNAITISAADTDTSLAATGLSAGTYKVYTIDQSGNLSSASSNSVTIS